MAGEQSEGDAGGPPGRNRIPWIVIGLLIVAMGAAGIAAQKKKGASPFKVTGGRAVVVPTADRARTVVVPPCSPPTTITAGNAAAQIEVPGAVAVRLPRGAAARTVVIPRCPARAAPAPGSLNLPSAAFVLGVGEQVSDAQRVPKGGDPVAYGIKAQVTVPTGSGAATIVAQPCQGEEKAAKTTVVKPPAGSDVAVAPRC